MASSSAEIALCTSFLMTSSYSSRTIASRSRKTFFRSSEVMSEW